MKIEDLTKGEYNRTPEGEPNSLTTLWGEELLRVNLIGTVIDKFVREDGDYATLHLDDGTGTIRAKAWSEDAGEIEKFEIGNVVNVIGKVREYNEEIHLVPEVIREVQNPNWELLREVEILEKRKNFLEKGMKPDFKEESGMETEELEISSPASESSVEVGGVEKLGESVETEEEKPKVSGELKDKALLALDKLEGEDGAEISDLAAEIDESSSKTEEILGVLLNEDKVYEPIAGKFKRL